MSDLLKNFHKLVEAVSKIKTVYSLAGLIVVAILTVVIYLISFPTVPISVIVVVLIFEGGFFVVLILLTMKISPPPPVPPPETSDSTLERDNLSVDLTIWENLTYCLEQIGFTNLEREKKISMLNQDYHFSWAEYDSAKLVFLQLEPQEFNVPNLRKVHSIIRIDLPHLANIDVMGYIIVCDTSSLSDECIEYLESLKETLKCLCFTNYTLTKIQRKDQIALTHLRAKLLPCVIC